MLDSALALGVSFPPLGDLAEFLVTAFPQRNPAAPDLLCPLQSHPGFGCIFPV